MPKFNQRLYDENDKRAKDALRKYLDSLGIYTFIQEDYKADIKGFREEHYEAEIKNTWKEDWPVSWRTIHIPARKKKYMDDGKTVIFWIFNYNCSQAWRIHGDHLTEDHIENIPNKRYPEGEPFYNIPTRLGKLVEIIKK
jgi:hypothetical protein